MEYTNAQTSQYVITAKGHGGVVQQTRSAAASAVVIAMELQDAGYTVEVLDPMGNRLSPARAEDGIRERVKARETSR